MLGRAPALVLAGLVFAGCGDSAPAPPVPAEDVKGTPFLVRRPEPPAPDEFAIGDIDATAAPAAGTGAAAAPPAPGSAAPADGPPAAPAGDRADEFATVSFDDLAGFEFGPFDDAAQSHEVPEKIRALSGRKVVVDGYMMPLQYEAGGAKKFLLMRYRFGCCYAVSPKVNEWIEVTMEGGAVADYIPDFLANAYGVLEVKEETRDGMATNLYRMKATRTEFTEAK